MRSSQRQRLTATRRFAVGMVVAGALAAVAGCTALGPERPNPSTSDKRYTYPFPFHGCDLVPEAARAQLLGTAYKIEYDAGDPLQADASCLLRGRSSAASPPVTASLSVSAFRNASAPTDAWIMEHFKTSTIERCPLEARHRYELTPVKERIVFGVACSPANDDLILRLDVYLINHATLIGVRLSFPKQYSPTPQSYPFTTEAESALTETLIALAEDIASRA